MCPTREQMEDIALIIPTKPARKQTGFRGTGFTVEETEQETEDEGMVEVGEVAQDD